MESKEHTVLNFTQSANTDFSPLTPVPAEETNMNTLFCSSSLSLDDKNLERFDQSHSNSISKLFNENDFFIFSQNKDRSDITNDLAKDLDFNATPISNFSLFKSQLIDPNDTKSKSLDHTQVSATCK